MAEERNINFISVFTTEDTSSFPIPEKSSMYVKCWGQLVATPDVLSGKIGTLKENKSPGVDDIPRKNLN